MGLFWVDFLLVGKLLGLFLMGLDFFFSLGESCWGGVLVQSFWGCPYPIFLLF